MFQTVRQLEQKKTEQTTTNTVGILGMVGGVIAGGAGIIMTGGMATPLIGKDLLSGARKSVSYSRYRNSSTPERHAVAIYYNPIFVHS